MYVRSCVRTLQSAHAFACFGLRVLADPKLQERGLFLPPSLSLTLPKPPSFHLPSPHPSVTLLRACSSSTGVQSRDLARAHFGSLNLRTTCTQLVPKLEHHVHTQLGFALRGECCRVSSLGSSGPCPRDPQAPGTGGVASRLARLYRR